MILIDANLLLYAYDVLSPRHAQAKDYVAAALAGTSPVCLCWPVIMAFVRISTNRRILAQPLTIESATGHVRSWLEQPAVRIVTPTAAHWQVLSKLLVEGQATGNLVTDAEIAALAIEHGCELHSTDADFARFPGLKWRNPLR